MQPIETVPGKEYPDQYERPEAFQRYKYGIEGNLFEDLVGGCCCPCCGLSRKIGGFSETDWNPRYAASVGMWEQWPFNKAWRLEWLCSPAAVFMLIMARLEINITSLCATSRLMYAPAS